MATAKERADAQTQPPGRGDKVVDVKRAFRDSLAAAEDGVRALIRNHVHKVLVSMVEQPENEDADYGDEDDEARNVALPPEQQQRPIREASEALQRQLFEVLEQQSAANTLAHKADLKASELAMVVKLERSRKAAKMSINNKAAEMEAAQNVALAAQASSLQKAYLAAGEGDEKDVRRGRACPCPRCVLSP